MVLIHEHFHLNLVQTRPRVLFGPFCLLSHNWSKWQHTTGVSDSTSVKQKSKGDATKRNLLTAKLGHGQENNRLYWLLTDFQIWCRLVQGFTTKGAFVRLLYKLILIALNQIWGSNFRVWMSRARNLNTLKSRSRNLKSQNVSGSQRKTLVSRSRKVSHLPFATPII